MQTIVKLFDTYEAARAAVHDLEGAGFATGDISLLHRSPDGEVREHDADTGEVSNAGVGATIGTLVGGGAGVLAGLGLMAIPGLGPVVAAGWLVAAATGAGVAAAAGGIIGSLTESGIEEADAHVAVEGVKRGGTLVTVRAADATQAANAETIMARHAPVSLQERGDSYRTGGWESFDHKGTGHIDDRLGSNAQAPHGEVDPTTTSATRTTLDGRV